MSISNSSLFSAGSSSQGGPDEVEWRRKVPTITLTTVDPSNERPTERDDDGVTRTDHTTVLVWGYSPVSSEEELDPDDASDESWHSAQDVERVRRDSTDTVVRLSIGGTHREQDSDGEEESETQDGGSTSSSDRQPSNADILRDTLQTLTDDELRNYTRKENYWDAEEACVALDVLRERHVLDDGGEGPIVFCANPRASTTGRRSKWSLSSLWERDTKKAKSSSAASRIDS